MNNSVTIGELAKALSKAQGEMGAAVKDAKNPFYKSTYADLASVIEAIREPFSKNGLAYSQLIGESDDHAIITTLLFHISGEFLSDTLKLKPVKNDPQGIGSAITYGRRYGLQAIAGLAAEDDDGNFASNKKHLTENIDGAELKVFDPAQEEITHGKHTGMVWASIPADYLEWMSNQEGANKTKAIATLEFLKSDKKQTIEDDIFDGAFDAEILQEDIDKYEVFKQAVDTSKKSDLLKWGEDNAEKIKQLPPTLLKKLKEYYKSKLGTKGAKK